MSMIATMMESIATLQRPAISRDSLGGTVQTYETIWSNRACNLARAGGRSRALYAQQNIFITNTVSFAEDPQVQANDRLIVLDALGGTQILLVRGRNQPLGRYGIYTVDCEFIDAPS